VVELGRREPAGHHARRPAVQRIRQHHAGDLRTRQNDAVEGYRFRCSPPRGDSSHEAETGDSRPRPHLSCQGYFPAALLRASLIRSCQPGPPCWKCSSTSWSIRNETNSFTPGRTALCGGGSGTFVVPFLNTVSASVRASFKVLGRL